MAHIKRGEKDSFDWPLAEVAVMVGFAPDVLGAAAPVPHRAKTAAGVLVGQRIDEKLADRAALVGASRSARMLISFRRLPRWFGYPSSPDAAGGYYPECG